jgi:alkyl hydroperoxide reductase subunit AhpC
MALGIVADPDAGYAPRATFVISDEGIIEQSIDTKDPGGQAAEILKLY